MMKKRLSKTLWYGSDIDKEGKPVLPPLAEEANDLEGIHEGELYLHLGDGSALLFTRSADGQVVQLGSNADELANYLLKSVWDKAFEFRTTENGEEYLFTKLNLATQYGITMYANGGLLDLPSIFEGLPIDNNTIYWEETKDEEGNVISRVLKSRGVGEGGVTPTLLGDLTNVGAWANDKATEDRIMVQKQGSSSWESFLLSEIKGSASFENVKESGDGNAFTSFDNKTLTFIKGQTFALKTELDDKWTPDVTKIEHWDAAYKWGNHADAGYMMKSVIYDDSLKCWKLDGDLLVTGGITMFANEGKYTPSTITDAVNIDGNTLVRVNGVIMLNPDIEFGGGVADSVAWDNVKGKPTWIGNNKPSYTTSEVTEGTNLYFTNARAVSALSSTLSNYLPLAGGTMTGTIQSQVISPKATDSYSLGTDEHLWSNVYTKLATIDGIEIKKSASGVLYIGGNLVVSGGITMYGTDGTTASTIWDNAPIANTNGKKGVASYDPSFFAVENGVVKFIGEVGGGGGQNLNITLPDGTTKVEYNGDAEKSIVLTRLYKSEEVTTATTDEGTITPLAMNTWTTSQFPLKNGKGATGEWDISIKGNASKVSLTGSSSNSTYRLVFTNGASGSNSSLYVDDESTATAGYNPSTNTFVGNGVTLGNGVYASIKTKGWYRFATTINAENVAGGSLIFSIRRQKNSHQTESYVVAVAVGYSGVTFAQLSGKHLSNRSDIASHAMITQVRATNYADGNVCFDFFYEGTSSEHNVFVNCIGTVTLQTPTLTTDIRSYTTVFDLSNGLKVDEIYSNSYRDIAYIRRNLGKNLLTNGDTSISANNYLVGSYQCGSTVVTGRTYRITFCGKLGENNTNLALYTSNGNTHITDVLGLSRTEEKIVSFTFKMKGEHPLRFYQFPNGKFGSYIRWAYLEEAYKEGELSTTTDYNNWLAEYNKLDARSFLYKIQRIDVGDSSYLSADKGLVMAGRGYWNANEGMVLSDASACPITLKRLNSSGGTYIKYFAKNQSNYSWAVGVDSSHRFGFFYQDNSAAIDDEKMWLDSGGNLLVTGGITMYSDIRKKTILSHVELSLKEVADAPLIEHYYNSDESKRTHVGSIAQYWAELNDWFCKEDGEGFLTMEIQNAALASAISVARELTRYESKTDKQIKKLKKRIGELEEEIENLKKV